MKSINKKSCFTAILTIFLLVPFVSKAQVYADKIIYLNIDWQLNMPFGSDYADKISGWGANFEGGYYITPNISAGLFVAFHTNNAYVARQNLDFGEGTVLNTDQQHSIFQLPFGASFRYTFIRDGLIEPYAGVRLGASYNEVSSYLHSVKIYDREWGFYASPEIGVNIFCNEQKHLGFHVAVYYDYMTNHTALLSYDVNGFNNWGVRVGLAF